MTRNVITISENRTMKQASKLMYDDNIGSIVILKEGGGYDREGNVSGITSEKKEIPTGIVTERDIARAVGFAAEYSTFGDIPLSEIMSKPLITVRPSTTLKDAVVLMQQKDIRRVPVLDENRQLVGIITDKDIINAIVKTFKKTIKDHGLMSEGFDLLRFLGAE
jgi:CBS domain-containing protein